MEYKHVPRVLFVTLNLGMMANKSDSLPRDKIVRLQSPPGANALKVAHLSFSPPADSGRPVLWRHHLRLEDRSGGDPELLSTNVTAFLTRSAVPELAQFEIAFPTEPYRRLFDVDLERALKQGVAVSDIYQTIQTYMVDHL